jgi:hypothetical protein
MGSSSMKRSALSSKNIVFDKCDYIKDEENWIKKNKKYSLTTT